MNWIVQSFTILFITNEYFKLFIISTRFWSRDQRFLSDRKRSNFALRPLLSNESNRMSLSLQLKLWKTENEWPLFFLLPEKKSTTWKAVVMMIILEISRVFSLPRELQSPNVYINFNVCTINVYINKKKAYNERTIKEEKFCRIFNMPWIVTLLPYTIWCR